MENFVTYIKSLEKAHCSGPVSQGLIIKSESNLGVKFSNEYVLFLQNFGNMMYRHVEILGLNTNHIDDCVSYTVEAREEDESIPSDMYVIANAGIDGVLILQNTEGDVFSHYPFSECIKKASSLENFIRSL
ncbi:MAG: SMI1/KNR4 family protein [Muribaculum sp.]|nr:SMI1/KNR4 family protein [Muribaculum sp.]